MKTLAVIFLLLISFGGAKAQELAGRKVIQGSLGVQISSGKGAYKKHLRCLITLRENPRK
ncbi:MAG: hypothetical protein LRY55_06570 [Leadbetterella sp.]|nr:hypothetical protein [Leadbetterella sp.]